MTIETGITVTVYADQDYRYEAYVDGELGLNYVEGEQTINIGFGSTAEMEAVAHAMLRAVAAAKKS